MNMPFIISDTHFYDSQIIKYENRPFKDVNEMNTQLINNWNSIVTKDDEVFHLGDFASQNVSDIEVKNLIALLNGKITLILGNHDNHFSKEKWEEMGIYQAIKYPIIYNGFFILSHEPLYINDNMPYANVFGHVHNNPSFKDFSNQSFCVSVERINYTPLNFLKIKDIILKKSDSKA